MHEDWSCFTYKTYMGQWRSHGRYTLICTVHILSLKTFPFKRSSKHFWRVFYSKCLSQRELWHTDCPNTLIFVKLYKIERIPVTSSPCISFCWYASDCKMLSVLHPSYKGGSIYKELKLSHPEVNDQCYPHLGDIKSG